jgi:MYXO-CTERM domain-containing protein
MLGALLDTSTASLGLPFSSPRRRNRSPQRGEGLGRYRERLGRERARLQAHFHEVLLELRGRDVSHLGAPQRAGRERLIEELARYACEGRFPRNDVSREPLPIFIDPHGTRCAMARLIESTGYAALVARVATHRNFALIRELEGDAALQAWLDEFGLTAAEAGRIQPEYCFLTRAEDCFCNQLGSEGTDAVLEGVVVEGPSSDEVGVRVDAVHGTTTAKVGDTVTADAVHQGVETPVGHSVLVAQAGDFNTLISLEPDDQFVAACSSEVPPLAKKAAIAGLLAESDAQCIAALENESSVWGESVCDGDSGCGCVAREGDASGALFVSTALLLAFARRRRRR